MQNHPRLIFFDVDGTIITADHHIPSSAVRAIHAAQARGNLCIVNTGRPYAHIEPAVTAIGFDGYICSCGQYILLRDKCLLRDRPDPQVCRAIVELVRRCDLDVVYEAEEGIFFDASRPIQNRYVLKEKEHYAQLGFDVAGDIDAPGFQFDKFCVYPRPGSDLNAFTGLVSRHFQIIRREHGLLEMVKLGCSKARGIHRVIQALGAAPEDCYAIGDSTNDLPMLQAVPHSIAMGHAPEQVKAAASYITDEIGRDGLARALAHFGLC